MSASKVIRRSHKRYLRKGKTTLGLKAFAREKAASDGPLQPAAKLFLAGKK